MKVIRNQTLATTHVDSVGERATKETLERICKLLSPRTPLHHNHDLGKRTLGYVEACHIIQDPDNHAEWILKGDVFFTCETVQEAVGGLSYSITEDLAGELTDFEFAVFIPFPHYNDSELVRDLASTDPKLKVGKWIKKGLEPETVALLLNVLAFTFAPAWQRAYDQHIAPALQRLLKSIPKLRKNGMRVELTQMLIGPMGEEFGVHFLPRGRREEDALAPTRIKQGLEAVQECLRAHPPGKVIYRMKVFFDGKDDTYHVFHIEYLTARRRTSFNMWMQLPGRRQPVVQMTLYR